MEESLLIINKLDQLRIEKKIGIKELSAKIGMTQNGLQKALKKDDIRVSLLIKLAEALNVEVGYFFGSPVDEFKSDLYRFLTTITKREHNLSDAYENEIIIDENDGSYIIEERVRFLNESLSKIYISMIYEDPNLFSMFFKPSKDVEIAEGFDQIRVFRNNNPEIFPHPINIPDFVKSVFNCEDQNIIKSIEIEVNKRESKFLEYVDNSQFINWMCETHIISRKDLTKILMVISHWDKPYFQSKKPSVIRPKRMM